MFLGTYLDYDYDTFFFSNAHSGLQSDGKQNTVKSRQIRSKATLCWYSSLVALKDPHLLSTVDSGGAEGARAPLDFGDSEKGLVSAYWSLAITMNTPRFKKLSTGLLLDLLC